MRTKLPFAAVAALPLSCEAALARSGHSFVASPSPDVRERPLSLLIGYPSEEQVSDTIGGNAVFEGASAARDASFPEGAFPIVVVSHGGVRSATDSGAWREQLSPRTA